MRRLWIGLGLLLGLGAPLALIGLGPLAEVVGRLGFGWWSYLARVGPKAAVSWDGAFTGLACLLLFTVGLHLFLRWLHGEIGRPDGTAGRRWRPRWTASIVAVVALMFVAGIAAAGIAHQAGWLLSSRRPRLVARLEPNDGRLGDDSANHLREAGLALRNYISAHDSLPTGKADARGRRRHSWQKDLLGFLPITAGEVHDDLPWDHPRNSAYFRGIVLPYLNPEIGAIRSPEGYALSHYAGNIHVLGDEGRLPLGRLLDESAGTIVAGEAAAGFKPWGDPTNLRDPDRGIGRSPDGFGGPSGDGANFLFLDGSVRFLKDTIDPGVLRRLSGPGRRAAPGRPPRGAGAAP